MITGSSLQMKKQRLTDMVGLTEGHTQIHMLESESRPGCGFRPDSPLLVEALTHAGYLMEAANVCHCNWLIGAPPGAWMLGTAINWKAVPVYT